ncbi:MAG: hypothetical protein DRP87_00280 [Spirochaetes bacterium]|nr:MAG: hypothetical protein DRP87_00280 [Spirochaetota bacterium]
MYKQRKLLKKLIELKDNDKIIIIVGPRQSGKTTLLKLLKNQLEKSGYRTQMLDLDIFSNYEKIATYENIVNYLKLNGYREEGKEKYILLLDEFQRYQDITRVLKNLHDHHRNIKIYATGSSSLTVKNSIQESLSGRKLIYKLYPLDFEEFLNFKEDYELLNILTKVDSLEGKNLSAIISPLLSSLEEFIIFGGYPEVVLTEGRENKREILRSIFDLYVKKELVEYLNLQKIYPAKTLIEYLAINNGQKINYDNIASVSGISHKTVKNYIGILEETFLIKKLPPFFTNKKLEIVKSPKIYFIDPGVVNYFIRNFEALKLRKDAGFLFETYILSEILKMGIEPDSLKHWEDKNKREVDIIIDHPKYLEAIEIKFKSSIKADDFRGINAFSRMYNEKYKLSLFLINTVMQYQKTGISVRLPFNLEFLRVHSK